jgi:hypothetical protein
MHADSETSQTVAGYNLSRYPGDPFLKPRVAIAALLFVVAAGPRAFSAASPADRAATFKDSVVAVMYIADGQNRLNILVVGPLGSAKSEDTLSVCNFLVSVLTKTFESVKMPGTLHCQNVTGFFDPGASNSAYVSTMPYATEQSRAEKPAVLVLHGTDKSGKHTDVDAFEIMKLCDFLPVGIAMKLCLSTAAVENHRAESKGLADVLYL